MLHYNFFLFALKVLFLCSIYFLISGVVDVESREEGCVTLYKIATYPLLNQTGGRGDYKMYLKPLCA